MGLDLVGEVVEGNVRRSCVGHGVDTSFSLASRKSWIAQTFFEGLLVR